MDQLKINFEIKLMKKPQKRKTLLGFNFQEGLVKTLTSSDRSI